MDEVRGSAVDFDEPPEEAVKALFELVQHARREGLDDEVARTRRKEALSTGKGEFAAYVGGILTSSFSLCLQDIFDAHAENHHCTSFSECMQWPNAQSQIPRATAELRSCMQFAYKLVHHLHSLYGHRCALSCMHSTLISLHAYVLGQSLETRRSLACSKTWMDISEQKINRTAKYAIFTCSEIMTSFLCCCCRRGIWQFGGFFPLCAWRRQQHQCAGPRNLL